VARVGDGVVTLEHLQRELRKAHAASDAQHQSSPTQREVLDKLILEEVLVQESIRAGILTKDDDLRTAIIGRVTRELDPEHAAREPTLVERQRIAESLKKKIPVVLTDKAL
jgi:hypothetical protein